MVSSIIPSRAPYHFVDYVVHIQFAEGGSISDCDYNSPLLIHFLSIDCKKERFVTTRQGCHVYAYNSQRTVVVPKSACVVSVPDIPKFLAQWFHPTVLDSAWLGTNCPSTFRYLRHTVGLERTCLMSVARQPYLSNGLQLLYVACEARKDRELHEYHVEAERLRITTLSQRPVTEGVGVVGNGNGGSSSSSISESTPEASKQKNVDWRNARASRVSPTRPVARVSPTRPVAFSTTTAAPPPSSSNDSVVAAEAIATVCAVRLDQYPRIPKDTVNDKLANDSPTRSREENTV